MGFVPKGGKEDEVSHDGGGGGGVIAVDPIDRLPDHAGAEVLPAEKSHDASFLLDPAQARDLNATNEVFSGEVAISEGVELRIRDLKHRAAGVKRVGQAGSGGLTEELLERRLRRVGEGAGAAGGVDDQRAALVHELGQLLRLRSRSA